MAFEELDELAELFVKERKREKKEQEKEEWKLRANFYRKIIEKHAALIDENEQKTIPELKSLVDKGDKVVKQLKEKVLAELSKEGVTEYEEERDFEKAARKAFEALKKIALLRSDLPVSFWLSFKDVIDLKAGDVFDKALLLCSVLRALGGKAKVRVLELENNFVHPVVEIEVGGRRFVLDCAQEHEFAQFRGKTVEEALAGFSFEEKKYLKSSYEFSDDEYNEF